MSILINIFLFCIVILLIIIWKIVFNTKKNLQFFREQILPLNYKVDALKPDRQDFIIFSTSPNMKIVVEIKNPIELARDKSGLAKVFSGLTPKTIVQQVYNSVVRGMQRDLSEAGAEAEIKIYKPE